MACDAEAVFGAPASAIDVFVVDVVDGTHALRWTDRLRQMGIGADRAYDGRSMKAQMKKADKSGARLAMIIGHDEVAADQVTLRPLRGDSPQIQCATSDVARSLTQLIEASS